MEGSIEGMGAGGMGVERLELGAMSKMFEDKICAVDFCEGAAVASLAQQEFCLNHFIDLCYENLQRIDPRGQKLDRMPLDLASLRAFIEECFEKLWMWLCIAKISPICNAAVCWTFFCGRASFFFCCVLRRADSRILFWKSTTPCLHGWPLAITKDLQARPFAVARFRDNTSYQRLVFAVAGFELLQFPFAI